MIKACGVTRSAQFLDDIKNLGYKMAFQGGLSFNLGDVIIPKEKEEYVAQGHAQVEEVLNNYAMVSSRPTTVITRLSKYGPGSTTVLPERS